jgi:hypothetical protein
MHTTKKSACGFEKLKTASRRRVCHLLGGLQGKRFGGVSKETLKNMVYLLIESHMTLKRLGKLVSWLQ